MKLFFRTIQFHFLSQWSSQTNFWAGVLGMLINNFLVLLGVWAMLFAGKEDLNTARDSFFMMNFVLMLGWGSLHVFLGGITDLDSQINFGALDMAMTSPRSPFVVLSLAKSELPAWGDVLLGGAGLVIFSFQRGFLFFIHSFLISIFAGVALYSFYLLVGSLAFWFRRTETANSLLVNICLAFNTYPIFDGFSGGLHWTIFLLPLLLVGSIPSVFLTQPTVSMFAIEVLGSLGLLILSHQVFYWGLKRYQSASTLNIRRSQ